MGQYHYLVNLDKKQVVHPNQIGNGLKLCEQIGWEYSTSTALAMLLASACKGGPRGGGDFHALNPLVGSWAGDRIAFVGDYGRPEDIPGCDAKQVWQFANAACHPELEKPSCGWVNLSPQVRAMMIAEFNLRYVGAGWLDIVDGQRKKAAPNLCPDLVIPSAVGTNPSLN